MKTALMDNAVIYNRLNTIDITANIDTPDEALELIMILEKWIYNYDGAPKE